ncbi:MAG TPA: hypothetical protein PKD24_15445 [Pyrinomonadaceae bacterium]|nr:hypothetical protein [Pyrinomonadaceae bacterium]HMP66815.1 hypothetical protein [Pyrinomonadaceae bacterium]
MKIKRFCVSKGKGFWQRLGICLLFALVYVGIAPAQEPTSIRKAVGTSLVLKTFVEIPKATEECTPEECEWWERLRTAGNGLYRKGDTRSTRQFVLLLVEGMEKSYRVPLEDRPPLILHLPPPAPFPRGFSSRNGNVELSVEYAAEGSVGEIDLVSGLRSDLDQRCILWIRETLFLPAVKDGKFVTEWRATSCGFGSSTSTR